MVKKTIGGAKNGGSREVSTEKAPKYYPADEVPTKTKRVSSGVAKLRSSITPGSVLILLAGRFRGKRVVCLKQLPSGLLLVTGPYAVNGVPLRRVNQAYVIATSTKVDVSKVDTSKISDSYFGKAKAKKSKKKGEEVFAEEEPKAELSADAIATQKKVDAALGVKPIMAKYLKTRFSLSNNDVPHKMCF
ncbi:MAG: hypothetical protein SGPRY_013584 [Prymnesium sp.]